MNSKTNSWDDLDFFQEEESRKNKRAKKWEKNGDKDFGFDSVDKPVRRKAHRKNRRKAK